MFMYVENYKKLFPPQIYLEQYSEKIKSPCDYAKSERGSQYSILRVQCRAVGRSENPGVPVLFGGHNLPHLVDIGLTDLPKFGHPRYRPVVKHFFSKRNI